MAGILLFAHWLGVLDDHLNRYGCFDRNARAWCQSFDTDYGYRYRHWSNHRDLAATQLQEQSLQFVPKIIAIGMTLVVGPWMLDIFVTYTIDIFERIATMAPGRL